MFVYVAVLLTCVISLGQSEEVDLLVLVPWPNPSEFTGRAGGLGLLPGARIAAQQINNRSDLLQGYRINIIEAGHEACGLTEQYLGLLNMVYFGINPFRNRNVAAVLGLYCSTSTASLSAIAGRENVQLLQLAGSNSPIFEQNQYPHLWRFLQSASIYANAMISLMDFYGWNRLAIIGSEGNVYHSGIALFLLNRSIEANKTVVYRNELLNLEADIRDQVLVGLVEFQARIVFLTAETQQIVSLLCAAYEKGMLYPHYLWIIPDESIDNMVSRSTCGDSLLKSLEGSVLATFNTSTANRSQILKPHLNISYNDFQKEHDREIENVEADYAQLLAEINSSVPYSPEYSANLYDQVWAFSIALNKSLPELKSRGIAVHDRMATRIVEEQLKSISFNGVSGDISFNNLREVRTSIDVFQVINGISVDVARRVKFGGNTSEQKNFNLTFASEFDDKLPRVQVFLHVGIITVMACSTVCLFILMSSVLAAMMIYRNEHEIKAVSPTLSLLMFIGCYLSIVSLVIITIVGSVDYSDQAGLSLCGALSITEINSWTIIFVTLFLKLTRVYKIFHNKRLKKLGIRYETWAIIVQVIVITAIPNILFVILATTFNGTISFTTEEEVKVVDSQFVVYHYTHCNGQNNVADNIFITSFLLFLGCLGIMNIYLASKITKVPLKDFRNTRLVNILVMLVFTTVTITFLLYFFFFVSGKIALYNIVIEYINVFLVVTYCLVLLFIPSVLAILRRKYFSKTSLRK